MATVSVTNLKKITIDKTPIAIQGEEPSSLTVTIDATLITYCTGKLTYVEFLTPDGRVIEKGGYDASSGTFSVSILAADLILTHDGNIQVQLVVRDVAEPNTTTVWKSNILNATIGKSI